MFCDRMNEDVRKIVESEATLPRAVIGAGKFSARKRRVVLTKGYQKRASQEALQPGADGAVQIVLPMSEVLASIEQGLGELVRKVGRMSIESALEIGGGADCWSALVSQANAAGIPVGWSKAPV